MIQTYELDHGAAPTREQGLAALIRGPRRFLDAYEIPPDPWGRAYVCRRQDVYWQVLSVGRDGREGTRDDIR